MTALELPLGAHSAYAQAINDSGEVACAAEYRFSRWAVYWDPNGAVVSLGGHIATDINERGDIIGRAGSSGDQAVLW